MSEYRFSKAVALVVFNRLDCVVRQLEVLRNVKPPRLYVISDGPRAEKIGEKEKVEEIRTYIEKEVDWECDLIKIYSETNMGCDSRTISGYSEVFKREEDAVLLEDDTIACEEYYRFAEKMLDYYKDDKRIMMISGFNIYPEYKKEDYQYYFSRFPLIYAFATWKRVWELFDYGEMKDFPKWNNRSLYKIMPRQVANMMRGRIYANYNGWGAWDSQFDFCMFSHEGFGVVSAVNLVQNCGTGRSDAFHASTAVDELMLTPYGKLSDQLNYRKELEWDREFDFCQASLRFGNKCDTGWLCMLMRERILRFVKWSCPKWLYRKMQKIYKMRRS